MTDGKLQRLPMSVDVVWLQSRPEIRFTMSGSKRGEVVFKAESPDELLGRVVNGYAHALVELENLKSENKAMRRLYGGLIQ